MSDMADGTVLALLPSLTGLGGGIELCLRQFLEDAAAALPTAHFRVIMAREPTLSRPELLSSALRDRLRAEGAGGGRRGLRIARFLSLATKAALTERPALVVCGHTNLAATAAAVAKASGAPLVCIVHGVEAWNISDPLTVRALASADRIVSVSAFTAAQLLRTLPIDPARLVVIPNAVDPERFTTGAPPAALADRLAARFPDLARPRLLTVCRLDATEQYKGVDVVIEALRRRPRLAGSYLVVGDGTDRPRLESLAARCGTPVRFWGPATDEDLPGLYRASDLFVMPSRNEGFGYVFIEALASGVPVIAGGVDGSVEALGGGALGLLINPLDPDEVADAIAAQLESRTPPSMRDPAVLRAEVVSRFGPTAHARRVAALLASLSAA